MAESICRVAANGFGYSPQSVEAHQNVSSSVTTRLKNLLTAEFDETTRWGGDSTSVVLLS